MGDLNLHYPGENKILENHNFHDLWLERHSHFDGYSWDPSQNSMINLFLPFDNRRMRLDRICLKNSKDFDLVDIQVVAKEKLNRIMLSPSDHFGLLATFKKSILGFQAEKNEYKREFNLIPKDVHGFRTIPTIVLYRVIAFLAIVLVVLYFIWKFINFVF
mmetsp:Transcript_17127/g.15098  ORF Transcript_17127/g.15098 Transcript_17127/m.15098 type:complete len:160 (+) Transcript_17127:517-996(+)